MATHPTTTPNAQHTKGIKESLLGGKNRGEGGQIIESGGGVGGGGEGGRDGEGLPPRHAKIGRAHV